MRGMPKIQIMPTTYLNKARLHIMKHEEAMQRSRFLIACSATLLVIVTTFSTPVSGQTASVTFTDHIRPIMERSCWNCHGEAAQLSDLNLSTRDAALEGGMRGPAVVPGRAEDSWLFKVVSGLEAPTMPMSGDPLTDAEVAAVRTWIDDGAHWDSGGATSATAALT